MDLITTYRILHDMIWFLNYSCNPTIASYSSNELKIYKNFCNTNIKTLNFSQKFMECFTPYIIITAPNFKTKLDL